MRKLYSTDEAVRIINEFTDRMGMTKNDSQDFMDGFSIYMEFVSAADEWIERMDAKKIKNGFKLFGWQDLDNE